MRKAMETTGRETKRKNKRVGEWSQERWPGWHGDRQSGRRKNRARWPPRRAWPRAPRRSALTWAHVTGRGPAWPRTARPRPSLPSGAPGPGGPERRRRRRRRSPGGGGGRAEEAAARGDAAAAACRPAEHQVRRLQAPCPSPRRGSPCPPADILRTYSGAFVPGDCKWGSLGEVSVWVARADDRILGPL